MTDLTKTDKTIQVSQEQENAIELLLQGQSDRVVAEVVGVTRQTIWNWRNNDLLFIATLNQRRQYIWNEAQERLKNLAGKSLDTLERSLRMWRSQDRAICSPMHREACFRRCQSRHRPYDP